MATSTSPAPEERGPNKRMKADDANPDGMPPYRGPPPQQQQRYGPYNGPPMHQGYGMPPWGPQFPPHGPPGWAPQGPPGPFSMHGGPQGDRPPNDYSRGPPPPRNGPPVEDDKRGGGAGPYGYPPPGPPPQWQYGHPPPSWQGGPPMQGHAPYNGQGPPPPGGWSNKSPPRSRPPEMVYRTELDMSYMTSRPVGPMMDDDGASSSAGGSTAKEKGRGSYKCGRCGVPKKGHVCPYQPKLKRRADEPPPELRNAAVQVEMDEFMTLRRLNLRIQGLPESYATEPYMGENMVVGEPHPIPPPPVMQMPPDPIVPSSVHLADVGVGEETVEREDDRSAAEPSPTAEQLSPTEKKEDDVVTSVSVGVQKEDEKKDEKEAEESQEETKTAEASA